MTSATLNAIGAEREELDWILSSGALGRSTNLTRMLTFICERHFEGRADEITEYRVAVEALGRRSDFDPHTDTIVRVTTHLLRKRLHEIYQGEGAGRPIQIVIPAGNYVPSFVPNESYVEPEPSLPGEDAGAELRAEVGTVPAGVAGGGSRRWAWGVGYGVILLGVGVLAWLLARPEVRHAGTAKVALPIAPGTVRALMGTGRKTYIDSSGNTWTAGASCVGGTNVTVRAQRIAGTEDPEIYLGGVRGITHCSFPVGPGMHEVRLYFSETSDLEPARRRAVVSVNAEPDVSVDVVDAAGGAGIAMSRVWTGVRPQNDGSIHIDYTSEVSPLNAVEILPAPSDKLLPVRIVAADAPYTDAAKQVWLSDRDFIGGRRGVLSEAVKQEELGVFSSDRIGTVRYVIPVVAGEKYTVKLYFRETWFGRQDGGSKAGGRRIFDVSVNGVKMLKEFDISAENNLDGIVKTFEHVEASPQGQIVIYLSPVVNYPLINAIEVLPEG